MGCRGEKKGGVALMKSEVGGPQHARASSKGEKKVKITLRKKVTTIVVKSLNWSEKVLALRLQIREGKEIQGFGQRGGRA